jgi:hypothetical protein
MGFGVTLLGGEERVRKERAFSQCFFGETVTTIPSEGKGLHGPLKEVVKAEANREVNQQKRVLSTFIKPRSMCLH